MSHWINGEPASDPDAALSLNDRSFLLGDGCFETLYFNGESLEGARVHTDMLRRAAQILDIDPPPADDILKTLAQAADILAQNAAPAVVRATLSRGAGGRGAGASSAAPIWVVSISAAPQSRPYPPLEIATSAVRRNETSPLSRIKSTSYGDNLAARREAVRNGADEALMLNTRGEAACLAMGTLFVLGEDEGAPCLLTPPVEAGARPGFMRGCLLAAASDIGLAAAERTIAPDALRHASSLWASNSLWGFRPISKLDGVDCRQAPDVTQELWRAAQRRIRAAS